jgi:cellulose synthase/poly-beta-1,6-N-acetylglucosamine synthase-like glycosyltransferase
MKISVLIPTYRRVQDLERCLNALKLQSRPADEIMLVVRNIDEETHKFIDRFDIENLKLKVVDVSISGQVAALNAGLMSSEGDIISITDDDAAPHPHWLEVIQQHFLNDSQLGGVGGRDWLYLNGVLQDETQHPGASNIVGKVQWFGRTIGNHHIGSGEARSVEILKGANMSYRRAAIHDLYFDSRLKGLGAQADNDMAFSLSVRKRGWKLIYDPNVSINHYLGVRINEDPRNTFSSVSLENSSYNQTLTILDYLGRSQRLVFLIWSILIGTRQSYGIIQMLRMLPSEKDVSVKKAFYSIKGKINGLNDWSKSTFLRH